MGFFALTDRYSSGEYHIEACHLSLWILGRPWYLGFGNTFAWDVGLRLTPKTGIRRIRVALPFDSDSGQLQDLSEFLLDKDFAPLIFGRPVTVNGDLIEYDATSVNPSGSSIKDKVVAVSTEASSPGQETARDTGFSTWNIEFAAPLKKDETAYVRFRFHIRDASKIWRSKGWGLAKRGAIADLRIADLRESIVLGDGRKEAAHIKKINNVFLFVICPSYFVPMHISPNVHYSRLLEPEVWTRYIASCGRIDKSTKLSIHQWRSKEASATFSAKPVDIDNPFRVYADFSREFGLEVLVYYIFGAAGIPIIAAASRYIFSYFGLSI